MSLVPNFPMKERKAARARIIKKTKIIRKINNNKLKVKKLQSQNKNFEARIKTINKRRK